MESGRFELGTDGPGTIVAGVDGSPTSMRALAYACGLTRRQKGRLVVVNVRTTARAYYGFDTSGMATQAAAEALDDVEKELREEVAHLAEHWHVDVEFVVRTGDPLKELAAVAEKERADAIVVGASTRIEHRLAGSIAVQLVRQRGWPVTVVP
jgi:nucleotide-binding universal stress UspA family protein